MDKRLRTLVTVGLAAGVAMGALDQTIVDTAFPQMISHLGGESFFTWVITAYMLAETAIVPVIGKLADIFGRKIFLLLGLVVFLLGSGLSGTADSMGQLIAFRVIQGLGAGMLMPVAHTIIGDLYTGQELGKLMGVFGAIFGLASVIGPKLGGWLTFHLSWRWVFYVNLPIGILAFLIILFGLKETRGERRPVDVWGSFTLTAGISLLLLGLVQGGEQFPWGSWQILSLFAGSVVMLGSFGLIERRVAEPVLDFHLFRNRVYSVMSILALLLGIGMFGSIIFVPWFIQGVVGVNPDVAGNVMTPMMLTMILFATAAGHLAAKLPYRNIVGTGFGLMTVGFVLMTRWSAATSLTGAIVATVFVGAGLGCITPILTMAVQNAVPARFRGQVTSGVSLFRSIGATLGTSIFGVVFNHQMGARFTDALAKLQPIPAAASEMMAQFAAKPQSLMQLLLRDEARAQVPELLLKPLMAAVKEMMTGSLHTVYYAGASIVFGGLMVALVLGRESLSRQSKVLAAHGEKAVVGGHGH